MIRRPPRSTLSSSSAASDVYKRQEYRQGGVLMNKDFEGEFKDLLRKFIEHKRALGYKYTTISENLRRFSIFTLNYKIENKVLTKEVVLGWTAKRKSEAIKTWAHRASDLRQFALYLQDLGYEAHIPSKNQRVRRIEYIPYIFTHKEIHGFFYACDSIRSPLPNNSLRNYSRIKFRHMAFNTE